MILLWSMSRSVLLPVFSYKSFMVSGLTFIFLIHPQFIYVDGVGECSNFILLTVAVQFWTPLIEIVCSPLYSLASFIVD